MKYLLLLLLVVPLASGLEWSEIHFDPTGSDDMKEFVELLGHENLTGCTVADSKSSDILVSLQHSASDIILIVETDSILNETDDTNIYGAGKAIGNGLGNTEDSLSITCGNITLLETSYDVDDIEGYKPGKSIIYMSGWVPGQFGGSPGKKENQEKEETLTETGNNREEPVCNTSLAITLGKVEGNPGDFVHFSIISKEYATFEAAADGTVFAYGDTLTTKAHSISLPNSTEVKLTARSEQCDARQRAVRIIKVTPADKTELLAEPVNTTENDTEIVNVTVPVRQPSPEEKNFTPTGAVIYDEDRSILPWISSFGMVTLIVSAWLFTRISRRETLKDER